jgi:glycosyltransferase involved in cell wall biosynthesis
LTQKIKIFVDAHVFDETYQGTSTYIKGIYSELVKNNDFEVTLAANNIEALRLEFSNPLFHFIQLPNKSKIKRLAFDIPKILKEQKFDYAHFQYILPLRKSCRYINTIHDLLFLQFPEYFPFKYRLINSLIFRLSAIRSDIICTVSEFSKTALNNYFNVNLQKIVLTPNAVDSYDGNFINVKEKHGITKYILFVSRFEPRKNHLLLLKSFIKLKLIDEGYKLVFIGRFKDVNNKIYENYYNSLNKNEKASVIYLENISDQELRSFYKQADLFVYPSLAEGFGIPPIEAAMLNCKVLCSDKTAMSDFNFFGKYLFDPSKEDELKTKMKDCLNEKEYPFEQIKKDIKQIYNWNLITEKFAEAVKKDFKGIKINRS